MTAATALALDPPAATRHALVLDVHGVRIGIDSEDVAVFDAVAHSYAAFRIDPETATATVVLRVRRLDDGRLSLDDGDAPFATVAAADGPVALFDALVGHLEAGLFASGIVPIHAGVVTTSAGAIVLAGPSGAGKSTLALALLRLGAQFASDELALVAPDDRTVLPFPRAIHVRPATLDLVPGLAWLRAEPSFDFGGGAEWAVEPDRIGDALGARAAEPAPVALVVLLEPGPDDRPDPVAIDVQAGVAAMELLRGAPTAAFDFRATLHRVASFAGSVRCVRVRPGNPEATAAAILALVATRTDEPRALEARARDAVFTDYARDHRDVWIQAAGRSMTPLIRPGDELLVAFGRRPERRGEVVLFERDGGFIAHRLVAWDRRTATPRGRPKGDAEPFADDPVGLDAVVGVVRGVRTGPDGLVRTAGLQGRSAASIARLSWSADRLARGLRRVTRRLPAVVGRPLLHATMSVASTTIRIAVAPSASRTGNLGSEGGETR